jgi:hypothetical protein
VPTASPNSTASVNNWTITGCSADMLTEDGMLVASYAQEALLRFPVAMNLAG